MIIMMANFDDGTLAIVIKLLLIMILTCEVDFNTITFNLSIAPAIFSQLYLIIHSLALLSILVTIAVNTKFILI